MIRYRIALIHNRDAGRLSHIRPAAQALADRWGGEVFEVFEQPPIVPHSRFFLFWRELCYQRADHVWRRHRLLKPRSWFNQGSTFARLAKKHALPAAPLRNARRSSAIEMILATKHIQAWRNFVEQGGDFLLVLEDDAVFKQSSLQIFDRVRNRIEASASNGDLYIDVAGGLELEALEIQCIPQNHSDGFIQFAKPVTNTACGYILSARTAANFCNLLDRGPWFRHLGIDWLINMLMVERLRAGSTFTCLHACPPVLEHGSFTGAYASSIRA